MKKGIALLCALALMLTAVGCSEKEAESLANDVAAAAESAVSEAAESIAAEIETAVAESGLDSYLLGADHVIVLSSTENSDGTWTHKATVDGEEVTEYDYTWNCDLSEDHEDVKNAPAEFFTGTEPAENAGPVYIAHDIYYYPEIPEDQFKLVNYDGEEEWAVYYPETSKYKDFIFGTLPSGKTIGGSSQASVPTQMMHSAEDAATNAKLHITEPGTYAISGTWHGQIWIDLGDQDDTFTDENAKVSVILNGADVTCTVAPALVFYSCYECDNGWEDRETYTREVDTANAGANVILADGSVNNFSGCNIFRMLKTKLKDEEDTSEVPTQKKVRKTDAAFYSYRTMNIDGGEEGTGVLNVTSSFEGLDSELHLTVNGGNVNIWSQDDGINCNEDGVSVVTVNGGSVHIMAGLGSEGDGVDSNGFLVINGGTVVAMANPASDSGLDSDCGSYVNGGTVLALGSTMDWAEADDSNTAKSVTMNLRFAGRQDADEAIIVTDTDGKVVFAYDPDKDEVASGNTRYYQGAVVSSENFKVGKEYQVYVGGDVTGTETAGMYDVATVTGFTDEAIRQGYSGQDGFGFGGGKPGDFDPSQMGDFDPSKMGEGGERPEMPEGQTPPDGKQMPENGQKPDGKGGDGQTPPEMPSDFDPKNFDPSKTGDGQTPPEMPDGFGGFGEGETVAAEDLTITFLMEDSVNNFSGVQDYLPEK